MIISKLKKVLVLGMVFTVLSSGVALAESVKILPVDSPDAPVSSINEEPRIINEEILEKQREIDKYLFEDHAEEIKAKGFTVTHTVPLDEYIEIGITPYSEENAEYLYGIFGEEQVKVIEGQQAEIYTTAVASDDVRAQAEVVSANEDEGMPESNSSKAPLYAVGAGVIILIGGSMMIRRKRKSAK